MSNSNTFFLLGAAMVGMLSAAGIYLAEHFRQKRQRHAMSQNLARIDQQLSCMQKELDQLRNLQKEKNALKIRKKRSVVSSASDDMKSATDLESSDLEFYDLSDEEDVVVKVPIETTLQSIDNKLDGDDTGSYVQALDLLTDLCLESPEDPRLLWRIGKTHYKLANASVDLSIKSDNIERGLMACQSALNVDPKIGDAHKWTATLIGLRSGYQPIKEKIKDGFTMRDHLVKALELIPDDSAIHHMLGRFAYETARLKWYERKIASTFFGEPPNATFEEALEHFRQADRLTKTGWKENKLFIAKSQIALDQYKEAVGTLKEANAIAKTNNEVESIDNEVRVLLEKYNGYS